ncbi:MAG: hypothetical protein JO149_00305, partial [Gammaproteobacteria bacterium]|nr:hypothetical protein [Gammaproteobacteria bacterium]
AILSTSVLLFISTCYAQSFFGAAKTPAPAAPATTKVMSSDDFKSMVNSLGQQNQTALSQQLNQQLSKQPPIQSTTTSVGENGGTNTNTTASTSSPTPPTGPVNVPPIPSGTPRTTSTAARPMPSAPMMTPNITPQAPVYTGFGSDNHSPKNASTSPSSTGDNSEGFKINY